MSTVNYGYYITLDEPDQFHADVRDTEGNTCFQVSSNDEGELWHIVAGHMESRYDFGGLCAWAIELDLLPPDSTIYSSEFFENIRQARGNALELILKLNEGHDIKGMTEHSKALAAAVERIIENTGGVGEVVGQRKVFGGLAPG